MTIAVALDYFPAKVSLPNGTSINEARVLVADNKVWVYVNQNGTVVPFFSEDLLSSSGTGARGYELQTESGVVVVKKASGCGCGNPIRSFNPWPGEPRMKIPL